MENLNFAMLGFMKFMTIFFVYGLALSTTICLINTLKNKNWFLLLGVTSITLAAFGYCTMSVNPDAQIAEYSSDFYYTLAIGLSFALVSGIFCFIAYVRTPSKQDEKENDDEEI